MSLLLCEKVFARHLRPFTRSKSQSRRVVLTKGVYKVDFDILWARCAMRTNTHCTYSWINKATFLQNSWWLARIFGCAVNFSDFSLLMVEGCLQSWQERSCGLLFVDWLTWLDTTEIPICNNFIIWVGQWPSWHVVSAKNIPDKRSSFNWQGLCVYVLWAKWLLTV